MTTTKAAATSNRATTTRAAAAEETTTRPEELPLSGGRPETGATAAYLARLFEHHARLVLGVCRGLLRDPTEAEDAAQQTFLSAYRSLLGGSAPREPEGWLATIARNECRGRIRSRMREPLAELADDLPVDDADALAATIRRADVQALRQALVELPRQQRDAFLLREFHGLSYEELARALSVSHTAVESLLFRARRQLRVRLEAAAASVATMPVGLRDWVLRLFSDGGSRAGAVGRLASLPLAAKLAAAGVSAAIVAGGAVALKPERHHSQPPRSHVSSARRPAATAARGSEDRRSPAVVLVAFPNGRAGAEDRQAGSGHEGGEVSAPRKRSSGAEEAEPATQKSGREQEPVKGEEPAPQLPAPATPGDDGGTSGSGSSSGSGESPSSGSESSSGSGETSVSSDGGDPSSSGSGSDTPAGDSGSDSPDGSASSSPSSGDD